MKQATLDLHVQLVDALRGRERIDRPSSLARLIGLATAAAMAYGAAMGSYSVLYGGSAWQMLFAALKSPVLLLVTFGLTLPSFVVLHLLLGLRDDLGDVLHALLSTQVALAITLLSLTPLTLLWYVSVPTYEPAILFNAAMFSVASFGSQRPLRARYAKLVRKNSIHARLLRVWLGVYAFVGIQMGWVLRPFIGQPGKPVAFLRPEMWDNAYVIVAKLMWRTLFGHH